MLRIGILGAASIAPASIIRPAQRRDDVTIAAVASRRASAAYAYAEAHRIERSYGDYESILADPTIDLIYNALPPSEHAHWSIAALEAGKDVLCEKPFAMNATQARRMRKAAVDTGHRLIEAFHDRYHPLSLELDLLKASMRLGEILSLKGDFSGSRPFDPRSIRHRPEVGGGALMDLGCYPVHWVRTLMGEEPTVTQASATLNSLGADLSIDASLLFACGAKARVTASMVDGTALNSSLEIIGTLGAARVTNLVFPSRGHSIVETIDGLTRTLTVRGAETYDHQLSALVQGIASGQQLPTEGEDSVANMILIDSIYAAAGIVRNFS